MFLIRLFPFVLALVLDTVIAKRSKVATLSVMNKATKSSSAGTGKGKGKKSSLNIQELHSLGMEQISTINVSVFEETNMLFSWVNTILNNSTHHDQHNSWYGEAINGIGSITLIQPHQSSRIAGSASFNNTLYSIVSLPNGSVQVSAMSTTDIPLDTTNTDEFKNIFTHSKTSTNNSMQKDLENNTHRDLLKVDNGSIIDIMCIYTRQALCQEAIGSNYCNITLYRKVMDDKCSLAVAETNVAYNLSGVQTSLRLVYSGLLDEGYNESTSFVQNINRLMYIDYYDYDPVFARIHELRDQYRADLVGLILDNQQFCGASPGFYNDAYYGFFSVNRICMTGYFSFGHEIGHTLGCFHDEDQYPSNNKPSQSAYGYQDTGNAFRTILSYSCANGASCPRIQRFSNPNSAFRYRNSPIGSTLANNVAQINSVLLNVANYRVSLDDSATSPPNGTPTDYPSSNPSRKKTAKPTLRPRIKPSTKPSRRPTSSRSKRPSRRRTSAPSRRKPTSRPTMRRSRKPSRKPSLRTQNLFRKPK